MLTELRVKNFALIKDLSVQFDEGLNVITGETGAGKSLVLKSLQLLMGGKAPSDIVGNFSSETVVEGLFRIEARPDVNSKLQDYSYLTEDSGELLVRRVISNKGRSKTYLNGSLATVSELKNIVSPLIELSGSSEPLIELTNQHDNKNLQNTFYQRDLFDVYCKNRELRAEISRLYSSLRAFERKLEDISSSDSERLQKIDFLNFQLTELEGFQPEAEDYHNLKDTKKELQNLENWKESLHSSLRSLKTSDQSVLSQLYNVTHSLSSLEYDEDSPLNLITRNLEAATDQIEEASGEVKSLISLSQEDDDESMGLSQVESRLSTYEHLLRKYNTDAEGLAEIYQSLTSQKTELEKVDATRAALNDEISSLKEKLTPLAKKLSDSRSKQKGNFEESINKHLYDLNMKDLKFKVKLNPVDMNEFGKEEISFWLSFSKGEMQERPIKKAASGGELSRILLAVKSSLENQEAPRTYLFDEIDAGVSGPTADKVGKKLSTLSLGQQVITITHLPQVAAYGTHHFLIEKSSGTSGQQTKLMKLKGEERIQEVARLISGEDITKASVAHATELMELR